jgi:hypothetical protein
METGTDAVHSSRHRRIRFLARSAKKTDVAKYP